VFLKINNKANLNDLKYTNKEENKDNLILNIIPTAAGFFPQLKAEIVRGMYPFYRNKTLFFFELLSALGFAHIFIIFFSDFVINATITKLNLKEVLEANTVYIYEKNLKKDYLKKSDAYKMSSFITLENIKGDPKDDISNFMTLAYKQAFANIAKGSLYIKKNENLTYEVYNTEVATSLNGYLYANTMLFFSALLKNDYDLDVTIFPEISYNSISEDSDLNEVSNFLSDSIVLIIVCLISPFGFVIFLGGLMFEKKKKKELL
jgi:hypothetical protein